MGYIIIYIYHQCVDILYTYVKFLTWTVKVDVRGRWKRKLSSISSPPYQQKQKVAHVCKVWLRNIANSETIAVSSRDTKL